MQFGGELRTAGAKDVIVVSGLWPESGKNALQDWLVAQVKDVLAHEPAGLHVVQDRPVEGLRRGGIILSTAGVDTVVSTSVYPNREGVQITLHAQPARVDHVEKNKDPSVALVSSVVPLTDEMTALLPPEWKRQMEEERNGGPEAPMADKGSVSKMPTCVSCPDPAYTRLARQFKVMGRIVVILTVETDGTASGIQLVKGVGFGLDEAAVEQVSEWRFNPALDKEGNPIATRDTIEVAFRLL